MDQVEEYINGSDVLLQIAEGAYGHCTSHTVTFNSETKERAVKPAVSAPKSTGKFKNKGVTGMSVSISAEGLQVEGERETGLEKLRALWLAGKSVPVKCFKRGSDTKPYLEGNFVIASLEESEPAQDDATYSISLENDGPVTLGEEVTA